jgi:membrane protein involved in colicin uptake
LAFARLSPIEKASFGVQRGAYGLAGALGGALGGQDPELQRVTRRQQVAGQIDYTNEDSIRQGMARLSDDPVAVQQLAQILRQQQESGALVGQRSAAQTASLAQASKVQLSIDQETKLRDELSKLPAGATEDDIRAVVVKYGDPDKVLTALTTAATRAEDREARAEAQRLANEARAEAQRLANEARVDAAKITAEARVDAAREAGANRLQIAEIQAANKREMAQLVAALKGPSRAVLKAQEEAEQVAEGKKTLGDILSTAQTLVTDLKTSGGMSSTSAGALSNLITSTQTGTAGQFLGGVFGTEAQSKRDQLQSVRLQLLNAIKEATGMSAQQLNSNVELQTYLKSLGSEGMTAEANLAIIDNLSKTYLGKSMMGAPTAVQPIYAQNPKTGARIMSTDGGKTWNSVR